MSNRILTLSFVALSQLAVGHFAASAAQACDAEDENWSMRVDLQRSLTTSAVENREPISEQSVFANDGSRVYVYLDVENLVGQPEQLTLQWYHEDAWAFTQTLEVGVSPSWRTWAYAPMTENRIGYWYVDVSDSQGAYVGSVYFDVQSPAPSDAVSSLSVE